MKFSVAGLTSDVDTGNAEKRILHPAKTTGFGMTRLGRHLLPQPEHRAKLDLFLRTVSFSKQRVVS